jgi:hypothetical protein
MTLHCRRCEHEWELHVALPMELGAFVERLKAAATIGCPKCFADGSAVVCGSAPAPKKRAKR